jgi:hypothetical protein
VVGTRPADERGALSSASEEEPVRRPFEADFDEALRTLVEDGTIKSFESDLGGLGSVLNVLVTVTVAETLSAVEIALVRYKVRQALAHLTDNVVIGVKRGP